MAVTLRAPAPLLGAHLSTAGGLLQTLARARARGCSCLQIFSGTPRAWARRLVADEDARAFREAAPGFGVHALVIHASYLVNLATPEPALRKRSLDSLAQDLAAAAKLAAAAVVVHPGSGRVEGAESRLQHALEELLPAIPPGCRLLLEGMAGQPGSLGSLERLGALCRAFDARLGVCLDTAHLCAAGYQLSDPAGFARLDRDLRAWMGYPRVGCVHMNDSLYPCGSHRDRHENLGEGYVGREGFQRMLAHPAFQSLPFILETPGFDQEGPDRKNMQRLRSFYRRGQLAKARFFRGKFPADPL